MEFSERTPDFPFVVGGLRGFAGNRTEPRAAPELAPCLAFHLRRLPPPQRVREILRSQVIIGLCFALGR